MAASSDPSPVDQKIVARFVMDTNGGTFAAAVFIGQAKRQRVQPPTPRAFIARAVAALHEALDVILGTSPHGTFRLSSMAEAHRLTLYIVVDGGPLLRGLTHLRVFGDLLERASLPFKECMPNICELYGTRLCLPPLSVERSGRRPLKEGWMEEDTFSDCFEPTITNQIRDAHNVIYKGTGAPMWVPPGGCFPAEPQKDALIYRALDTSGVGLRLIDVCPDQFQEDVDSARAILSPARGFTCPAGVFHQPGTRATVEVGKGFIEFTCHGPSRGNMYCFGSSCCVDRYGPVPPPMFDLEPHMEGGFIVDPTGVERAEPLLLEDILKIGHNPESAEPGGLHAVGLQYRCGSGKTTLATSLALDFLRMHPTGRIVYSSSNRELVRGKYEELKKQFPDMEVLHYEVKETRDRLRAAPIVSVCTSSLALCIGESSVAPTLLILDEPESTVGMLSNLGGVAGVNSVVGALRTCAATPLLILALDSHLNTGTEALLAAAGFQLKVIRGTSRPCKNFKASIVVPYQKTGKTKKGVAGCGVWAAHLVAEHVRAGRSVLVPCSTISSVLTIGSTLRSEFGDEADIFTLTATNGQEHRSKVVDIFTSHGRRDRPLVILFTATICVGLDAGKNRFDAVVGAFSGHGPTPATFVQMMCRLRPESMDHSVSVEVVVMDLGMISGRCSEWKPDPVELDWRKMDAIQQQFVEDRIVSSAIALHNKEMLGEPTGPGPYFLKRPDCDAVQVLRKAPRGLYTQADAAAALTDYARRACAASVVPTDGAYHEVAAGAKHLSHACTHNVHMNYVITAPSVEMNNRASCGLARLGQLLEWEFGSVSTPPPLDLTARLQEDTALAHMQLAYTDAAKSVPFAAIVELANRMEQNWLPGAPQPLHESPEARTTAMVRLMRDQKHLQPEPSIAQGDGEEASPDAAALLQPSAEAADCEFWSPERCIAVFQRFDLTIGLQNAAQLVKKVREYAAVVDASGAGSYSDYLDMMVSNKKDPVPDELKVGGTCPVLQLTNLYARDNTAPLVRAYCALKDDVSHYNEATIARLRKLRRHSVVGHKVPHWVKLCAANEVIQALPRHGGSTPIDLFAVDERERLYAISDPVPRSLIAAVNARRSGSRQVKDVANGVSRTVGTVLAEVEISTVGRGRVPSAVGDDEGACKRPEIKAVVPPPLVREFVCGPPTKMWAQLRREWADFWSRVNSVSTE